MLWFKCGFSMNRTNVNALNRAEQSTAEQIRVEQELSKTRQSVVSAKPMTTTTTTILTQQLPYSWFVPHTKSTAFRGTLRVIHHISSIGSVYSISRVHAREYVYFHFFFFLLFLVRAAHASKMKGRVCVHTNKRASERASERTNERMNRTNEQTVRSISENGSTVKTFAHLTKISKSRLYYIARGRDCCYCL